MGSNETGAKSNRSWTEVVTAKRAIRDAQIRKHEAANRNGSFDILGADIADVKTLTNLLESGQVSAENMIRTYIGRACEAPKNSPDELLDIDQARHLDNFQRTHGRLIGPLHGVPMSAKDQFNIKGLDSTLGYVCNASTPAKSDAPLVHTLKQLGAIIIAKTNLPQSIMGLTTHPTNSKLTPGGSSGGEAALRALEVSLDGQQHVPSAVGPMAKSLSSLTVVTKLVIAAEPWTRDPQLPPIPWRDNIFQDLSTRPLVIGTMLDGGAVRVHPPIKRNSKCIKVMDEYYAADGGEDIRRAVTAGGEPFVSQIQAFVDRGRPISVFQYWQLNKRKAAIQQAYHDMWDSIRSLSGQPVDVLLVPTMPHTAVPHGSCRWTGYTKVFNFLDYTALTFPAGIASKDQDQKRCGDYAPRNAHDAWNWGLYDPSAMDGHSIGLQIVGRRFEEEKVLGAAQHIQQLL
ncbi:amidase signature domain-containing protein [Aspergillus parasiticus]|uniref:Amidase signature domain-containing protein n=1 Tax=Aspergillus parasiticus TaxID=5067 RepID=A0A5N6DX85_ASPPA|nr:amidase signature domain-containing protein [Aspergillus parasiticus]